MRQGRAWSPWGLEELSSGTQLSWTLHPAGCSGGHPAVWTLCLLSSPPLDCEALEGRTAGVPLSTPVSRTPERRSACHLDGHK